MPSDIHNWVNLKFVTDEAESQGYVYLKKHSYS